ncbi:unnamed protein product, partial [Laminaria digitata]
GTGSRGSGRNRRRGSPFAALSDAYKPSRVMFSPFSGRDGGEVVALRSSNRAAWPAGPLERVTADPRHLQQPDRSSSSSSAPTLLTPPPSPPLCVAALRRKVSRSVVPHPPTSLASSPTLAAAAAATGASSNSSSSSGTGAGKRPTLRRRVTWACEVSTVVEVTRTASADVFSPDLHSLQIAKRLAVLADEPELARAAEAVSLVRRQAAVAIRSLTSRHGWTGSLDGLEEASRLWAGRELTYMNETDELAATAAAADGGDGDDDVWSLKADYRTARRRMKDADSD